MMIISAIIVISAIATVSAQCPEVPPGGCNICGNDPDSGEPLCVQSPDVFLDTFSTTCGILECEDRNDQIEPFLCGIVQMILDPACNCGTSAVGSAAAVLTCPDSTSMPSVPSQPPVTPVPSAPTTPAPIVPPTPTPKASAPTQSPGTTSIEILLNAGGDTFQDANGNMWVQDSNYLTDGGENVYAVTAPISGNATIEQLYQSERFGQDMTYVIDNLLNGDYDVYLHFAEIYHQTANKREFSIQLQGVDILGSTGPLDIWAETGARYVAHVEHRRVTVTNEALTIEMEATIDNAKISGIELRTAAPAPATAAPVLFSPVAPTAAPVTPTDAPVSSTQNGQFVENIVYKHDILEHDYQWEARLGEYDILRGANGDIHDYLDHYGITIAPPHDDLTGPNEFDPDTSLLLNIPVDCTKRDDNFRIEYTGVGNNDASQLKIKNRYCYWFVNNNQKFCPLVDLMANRAVQDPVTLTMVRPRIWQTCHQECSEYTQCHLLG